MKHLNHTIGVGAVKIGTLGKKYVLDALNHNRLSYGTYSLKFENEFSAIHGRRFSILNNSGTSALQVGFHALKKKYNWPEGSEVIVPALTFVASINTILQNGLKPVFVDIEPQYYSLDPEKIEEKITSKTVAIEPVHLFGQPCDMDPIMAIAQKHNLRIIEDSCETMFAKYNGKIVGSFGDISCFSTYSAHLIVTGVGGFTTTDDSELASIVKSLCNHGRDGMYLHIDDDDSISEKKLRMIIERRFSFNEIGYSYRVTEMEAALGLAQLQTWEKMIQRRKENASYLTSQLQPLSEKITLPKIRPQTEHVFMVYPIMVLDNSTDPFDLMLYLEDHGIETRYLLPTLVQPVYRKIFGNIAANYPVSLHTSNKGFYIGCHQELLKKDLDYVVECIFDFFKKSI